MTVKSGDYISVHYEGKLDDGKVFDSSFDREPLVFEAGAKQVIAGFDNAVLGKNAGDEVEVSIPAKEAYGEKQTNVTKIPKSSFNGIDLKEGSEVEMMSNMGPLLVEVKKIGEEEVEAILNHPLAGKTLNFKIKIEKILDEKEKKKHIEAMNCSSCGGDCSGCHK